VAAKRSQPIPNVSLRENEERLRLIANAAPVLLWLAGTDKLCTYVNQRWLEFTGRMLEQELGNGWTESFHPDDVARCLEVYFNAFDRRESFQMEYRLRRHDGEYRWILDSGTPTYNQSGSFDGYIGSAVDVTERKLEEDALSKVSQRLIEAQEKERSWIARELHDDINQRLAMLAMQLDLMAQKLPAAMSEMRRKMVEVSEEAAGLSSDIQALSHRLHSSSLKHLGLADAGGALCREFSTRHRVKINFQSETVPKGLAQNVSLCLFRVLQEALQNAIKHSGAARVQVSLTGRAQVLHLTVRDDGAGFNPEQALVGTGLGLTSMKERMKLVNGHVSIDSEPGRGTVIHARVPLQVPKKAARPNT
jgi:PAS domain S-box-containing protein